MVPEEMLKLLVDVLTVIKLGVTVPFTVTEVGTPGVSSNKTLSPWLNTVCVALEILSQLAEVLTSHCPLLPLGVHCRWFGTEMVRAAITLLVVPLALPITTL